MQQLVIFIETMNVGIQIMSVFTVLFVVDNTLSLSMSWHKKF